MSLLRTLRGGLRSLVRPRIIDRELDDEIRHYLDAATQEHIRAGMTPDAAERAALVAFGGVETAKETKQKTWNYPEGMKGYLKELIGSATAVAPIYDGEKFVSESDANGFAAGEGAAWAFAFVEDGKGGGESYANLIPTVDGGTHEAGLREGIFEAVKSFVEYHNLIPKGVKLLADDAWSCCIYVLAAKVLEPQFHGQTKEKLSNRDAVKLVSTMVRDPFALWMNGNVEHGKKICNRVIQQAIDAGIAIVPVGDPVFYEPLAVAMDLSGPDPVSLQAKLDEILQAMHDEGTLSAYSMHWFGIDLTTVAGT